MATETEPEPAPEPGPCERCGIYALLRAGYPYCAACRIVLALGNRYLFTVGG